MSLVVTKHTAVAKVYAEGEAPPPPPTPSAGAKKGGKGGDAGEFDSWLSP